MIKPLLQAMRERFTQTPSTDAAAGLAMHKAFSSHEGAFMFNAMRDFSLEKSDGLDEEARRMLRSWGGLEILISNGDG